MNIRIVGHEGQANFPFGDDDAWAEFKKVIEGRGHIIEIDAYGAKTQALISHNHSKDAIKESVKSGVSKSKKALVIWEPRIVDENRYRPENLNKYGWIFAASPIWADEVKGKSINWPQNKSEYVPDFGLNWLKNRDRIVMIQGNKFSAHRLENYSLRRNILHQSNLLNLDLDLYGVGWNKGFMHDLLSWIKSLSRTNFKNLRLSTSVGMGRNYKNYKGSPNDKFIVMRNYKLSIVIENSPDFVSEKLFDSAFSGCLTFYIGPNLKKFGIDLPPDTIGDQNLNLNLVLIRNLLKLSPDEQRALARSQYDELSRVFPLWESRFVLRKLANEILDVIE